MTKSNENEAGERMARVVAAIKTANVPDYVVSRMQGLMPKGTWQITAGGPKPDRELLVIAGLCTKQTAGCEGGFHALQLRDGGSSLSELSYSFNAGPAHNHTKAISQGTSAKPGNGWFWREQIGVSRWRLTITAKGEKYIMAKLAGVTATVTASAAEKPAKVVAKPAGKPKAKKATTVAPAETPASEAATVTVTAEANQATEPVELEPVTETVEMSGVDPEHDQVTPDEIQALANHFNS